MLCLGARSQLGPDWEAFKHLPVVCMQMLPRDNSVVTYGRMVVANSFDMHVHVCM